VPHHAQIFLSGSQLGRRLKNSGSLAIFALYVAPHLWRAISPPISAPALPRNKHTQAVAHSDPFGRYLLQVDKQTKGSYKTPEAAQSAALEIKIAYPIVQVSIYDSVDNSARLVELPDATS